MRWVDWAGQSPAGASEDKGSRRSKRSSGRKTSSGSPGEHLGSFPTRSHALNSASSADVLRVVLRMGFDV